MKTGWIFTVFAFAVALFLHWAAVYSVDLAPGKNAQKNAKTFPRTFMVNPVQPIHDWEKELGFFSRLKRPDLWAMPNYSIGFGSGLQNFSKKHYSPPPAYSVKLDPAPMPRSVQIKMARKPFTFRQFIEEVNLMPAVDAGQKEETERPALSAKIIWRLADGELLDAFPTRIPANLHQSIANKPPDWYTKIEIMKHKDKPVRIRLRESCGNSLLDQFAIKLLGRKIALAETDAKQNLSKTEKKLWPRGRGPVVVEVEWRPAASELKTDNDEKTQKSAES